MTNGRGARLGEPEREDLTHCFRAHHDLISPPHRTRCSMRRKSLLLALAAVVAVLCVAALIVWFTVFHIETYSPEELSRALAAGDPGEHSIVLVGDIMTWDDTESCLRRHGVAYPFLATLPLLSTADLTIGNLEGPIADAAAKVTTGWSYRVPSWTVPGLERAGFDGFGLANNHVLDCGPDGLAETIEHLRRAKMGHFGAGSDLEQASRPMIADVDGVGTVALVGLLAPDTLLHDAKAGEIPGASERVLRWAQDDFEARTDRAGTVVATVEAARESVESARRLADLVIVFIHWGIRYQRTPSYTQRRLALALAEAGADLVVGHHAHFWQPVGREGRTPIVYGTGNFAFGSNNWNADEALAVRVIAGDRKIRRVEFFPIAIRNVNPRVNYQPKVLKGRSARNQLGRLVAESRKLGVELVTEGDRAVLPIAP